MDKKVIEEIFKLLIWIIIGLLICYVLDVYYGIEINPNL